MPHKKLLSKAEDNESGILLPFIITKNPAIRNLFTWRELPLYCQIRYQCRISEDSISTHSIRAYGRDLSLNQWDITTILDLLTKRRLIGQEKTGQKTELWITQFIDKLLGKYKQLTKDELLGIHKQFGTDKKSRTVWHTPTVTVGHLPTLKSIRYKKNSVTDIDCRDNEKDLPNPKTNKPTKESLIKSKGADSEAARLAGLLWSLILERKPDHRKPNLTAWSRQVDLMLRTEARKPERIEAVIRWCQSDAFWCNNILSTSKLRDQFDQLELKMSNNGSPGGVKHPSRIGMTADEVLREMPDISEKRFNELSAYLDGQAEQEAERQTGNELDSTDSRDSQARNKQDNG